MKVSIYGSGYVGLVTAACLAEMGNEVMCMDVDENKINLLNNESVPIYEPGLKELIKNNIKNNRLSFTTDVKKTVDFAVVQIIAVGTPPDEDGSADLQYVLQVAENIANNMQDYKIIVDKSTVPVGTADEVENKVKSILEKREKNIDFEVVSNPEFLKEGDAISDFMKPDRIIIGVESDKAKDIMHNLYAAFNRNHDRVIMMDIKSAELTKYAANAMLATKISFMNELANLAEKLGADIEKVRNGIGSDTRIGYHFIYPGVGYGGSCFPKDVQALEKTANEIGYDAILLNAVETVNKNQKQIMFNKLQNYFTNLKDKTIAIWGLAFKPNTDDMREASSRVLMESLWAAGANVRAYDPKAIAECKRIYPASEKLTYGSSPLDVLDGADALVIMTEWKEFRNPNFKDIKNKLKQAVIFDGRNIYEPDNVNNYGIKYISIGRN